MGKELVSGLGLAFFVTVGGTCPRPAAGQVYLGVDATFSSPYVWRGVTRANGWMGQPGAFLAVGLGGAYVSAGAWANYELRAARVADFTVLGSGRSGLGEADYWAQVKWPMGGLQTWLGGIRYTFRGRSPGLPSDRSTTELYGGLQATSKYVVPALAVWVDVDHVRGVYVESSATIPLLANPLVQPFVAVFTRVAVGYSVGQEVNNAVPTQGAYFAESGVTHVDFSAASDIHVSAVPLPTIIHIEGHLQASVDDRTRPTSASPNDARRSLKVWLTTSVQIAGPLLRW